MDWLLAIGSAIPAAALAAWIAWRNLRGNGDARLAAARAEAAAIRAAAEHDAHAQKTSAEADAREQSLEIRAAAEREFGAVTEALVRREETALRRELAISDDSEAIARIEALRARDS